MKFLGIVLGNVDSLFLLWSPTLIKSSLGEWLKSHNLSVMIKAIDKSSFMSWLIVVLYTNII